MKQAVLIENGQILTMSRQGEIENGSILIEGGKITGVGKKLQAPKEAEIIDAKGGYVIPGIIDAHSHIGIFETGVGDAGVDGNEGNHPVTPEMRGIDGINPLDPEFERAVRNGITTVATGPGSANPIGGQFAAMKTAGKILDDMILKEPLAMKIAFGENPKNAHGNNGRVPGTRMGTAAVIREWLYKAREYAEKKDRNFNMKLEALLPVIEKKIPLKAHVHRADDIMTALRIAEEFDLDITLDHCSEGHLIADRLAAARQKGVIIDPFGGFPHKNEVRYQGAESGKILYEAGVKFAIMTDLPAMHEEDLITSAGMCYRFGLPMMEALKAITINPAEILSLDNQIGSLELGKDGDAAIFDKNPITQMGAHCICTLIDGKIVHRVKEEEVR